MARGLDVDCFSKEDDQHPIFLELVYLRLDPTYI